ncbi:MAG: TylF/MycF/NovP-related O-methyltransferase [Halieaceae bacterium]
MSTGINREGAFKRAFEFIYKSETRGSYVEFGTWQGSSLIRAIRQNNNWSNKTGQVFVEDFYGFDSFQGLPVFLEEDALAEYEVFKTGQFSDTSIATVTKNIQEAGLSTDMLRLIPGFFADSLKSEHVQDELSYPVAIAHIDCDLLSSAAQCLDFLETRLTDGAIVMFDDWFCYRGRQDKGVRAACSAWQQKSQHSLTEYFTYSWAGMAFICNLPGDE